MSLYFNSFYRRWEESEKVTVDSVIVSEATFVTFLIVGKFTDIRRARFDKQNEIQFWLYCNRSEKFKSTLLIIIMIIDITLLMCTMTMTPCQAFLDIKNTPLDFG